MSAIPPKADIDERWFNVRFVPITDIARCVVENKQFRHYASVRWKSLLGFCVGGAFADIALIANAMKHPARSDFHTVVTAAGVSVTFKPTNSTYSFFRFLEAGALSLAGIQHAGRDTGDYPSDEVQDMAQQIASGHASVHFGPFQDEEEVNRVHWRKFATQAKRESEPTTISESIVWSAAVSNSAHKNASDLRMLAKVEKWIVIFREINREQPDRHRVDYVI
jgi:hypothetical protein